MVVQMFLIIMAEVVQIEVQEAVTRDNEVPPIGRIFRIRSHWNPVDSGVVTYSQYPVIDLTLQPSHGFTGTTL